MKKLLYIGLTNYDDATNGVTKKVISQVKGIEKNDFETTLIAYSNDGVVVVSKEKKEEFKKKTKLITRRKFLFNVVMKTLKKDNFDSAYIRYPHVDLGFLRVLKELKKQNTKIYIEVPSYPIVYKNRNFKSILYRISDLLYTSNLKKYVYKMVVVGSKTNDVFKVDAINIPNGINTIFENKIEYKFDEKTINIISVSGVFSPHGYDLLIAGLREYYNNSNHSYEIFFHLVGDGPVKDSLIKQVSELKLDSYVKFYPNLSGDKLDEIYQISNMGCGPLGIHRIGYKIASPLKTKDYFIRGLPFFCSYEEIGVDLDYPYILRFNGEDKNIDFEKIVCFFETYINKFDQVSKDMKEFALKNFTWEKILDFID